MELLVVFWGDDVALLDTTNRRVLFTCRNPEDCHCPQKFKEVYVDDNDFKMDEPTWDDIWEVI